MSESRAPWLHVRTPHTSSVQLSIDRLNWSIAQLAECGIHVPAGGRHYQALRLLQRVSGGTETVDLRDAAQRLRIEEAERSAWELMVIVTAAWNHQHTGGPFTERRVREALEGGVVPAEPNPTARNKQFELYVGALLALGGLVVFDGEPDLRVQLGHEIIGIAAKRSLTTTVRTVRARVREAAEQLRRVREPESRGLTSDSIALVGGRGFVALSLDSFYARDPENAPLDVEAHFSAALDAIAPAFRPLVGEHAVMGVLVFGCLMCWSCPTPDDLPRLDMELPIQWIAVGDDVERHQGRLLFQGVIGRLRPKLDTMLASCPRHVIPGPRSL